MGQLFSYEVNNKGIQSSRRLAILPPALVRIPSRCPLKQVTNYKMKKIFLFIVLSVILLGCNGEVVNQMANDNYITYKKEFASNLTDHFPSKLTSYPTRVVNNKYLSKNDVGLLLYEYDVAIAKIDSIESKLKDRYIAKYTSKDSCLIIVNRFETVDTHENRTDVEILDTAKVENDCFKNKLPIPNFIDYKNRVKGNLKLDGNFIIYVLEAKSGNNFKEYDLLPNFQMPKEWKNGYSSGIAVSKEKKTVIYWGVIW